MYNNIGRKIKDLAKTLCIVMAILYILVGIVLMALHEAMILVGLLIMILGPVITWISSWLLYGYGQLIENSDILAQHCLIITKNSNTIAKSTDILATKSDIIATVNE